MKTEIILWFLFFAIGGVLIAVKSLQSFSKFRNPLNVFLTLLVLFCVGFAEILLYEMFFDNAWPTYLPHILLLLALILFATQTFLFKTANESVK